MNNDIKKKELSSLISLLTDLANEIDGVVDLGITVCLMDDKKADGRQGYIVKRSEKIRLLVKEILTVVKHSCVACSDDTLALQSILLARSELFLTALSSLERFRILDYEALRSATDAFYAGWSTLHRLIRITPEVAGFRDNSWYSSILQRQNYYRERSRNLLQWFREASITSATPKELCMEGELFQQIVKSLHDAGL